MLPITLLMSAATVALAGIGGLYYSYACSVMPGLRAVDDATFVSAMSRINTAIQNPVFALSFVGAFLALMGATAYSWAMGLDSALPASVALACYTATLAITFGVSIPLNNRLGHAAAAGETAIGRKSFERPWTRWNIHRTWLSLAALVALCVAWASLGQP
ncbi:anthrone oxygenase family protein [Pseudarthrobacter sulfonivorans]|uniref:anthrone oxygenase family protein n=1 Tax=Pseudarthrobacter sulfonivorans TaxID=121292 RepID=UPI0028650E41|nr:anthrone oxygenase family protein [Pseudarthrobacter sulfonivorans]MDR6414525.1 putative membrane protein [Pseudarthrobacter sulfonivorans]